METVVEYSFIIDTDKYAGNFERDMCAFLTGEIGECGVGDEYVDEALDAIEKEFGDRAIFGDYVEQRTNGDDNSPCYRSCQMTESKDGELYNSVEIYFSKYPEDNMISFMKKRAFEFAKKYEMNVLSFRMLTIKKTYEYADI